MTIDTSLTYEEWKEMQEFKASAVVVRGVTNNTIRMRRPGGGLSRGRKPPRKRKPKLTPPVRTKRKFKPRPVKKFRRDPDLKMGPGFKKITVCLTAAELAELDAFAGRVQMARSYVIRRAVKHFRAMVLDLPGRALK